MATTVLLVSAAPGWFGTARMPRALARAGFNVAPLAPRGSLAEKSRYVSKIQSLDNPVSAQGWLGAFAEIVACDVQRQYGDRHREALASAKPRRSNSRRFLTYT
jgi:hypothetical protein